MVNANNTFLFLAYSLVWIVFMLYAWRLSRRQAKLAKDFEELKRRLPVRDDSRKAKV
jgi:CcmD family protein